MALRWVDDFDHYVTADLAKGYTSVGAQCVISAGNGRNSTASARGGSATSPELNKTLDAQAVWIAGFAIKLAGMPTAQREVIGLRDAGSDQLALFVNTDGTFTVKRGGAFGTVIGGPSTAALGTGVWYFVEFKGTIDNSGSFEARIDGTSVLSGSADTQQTANASANSIRITVQSGYASTVDIDDLYICDGQGSVNNDFLGDRRAVWKGVSGAGDNADFTPSAGSNYQNVDEAAPDGDTTYNSSSTAGHQDDFTLAATGVAGTIKGVQVVICVRKDDAGARSVKPYVSIGGVLYYGSTVSLGTSYVYVTHIWETNPATSSAWTVEDLDNAKFGYELVS